MAIMFAWTTTVIVAISAGGAVLVLFITLAIYLTIRCRKKRLSGRLQNARLRRMSRYPGGNLSITSSEVGQLPSFRNVRHRPFSRGPYSVLAWSRIGGSRDTLTRISCRTDNSRATMVDSYSDLRHTSNGISWPLQPSAVLTREYAGGPMSTLPLSAVDHKSFHPSEVRTPVNATPSKQAHLGGSHVISCGNELPCPRHPSPLMTIGHSFRAHRRNTSTGFFDLATSSTSRKVIAENSHTGPKEPTICQPPPFRRTLSLHSQQSGRVPRFRPESPPPDVPRNSRLMALRSHPTHGYSRSSIASSTSISSSKCEDGLLFLYPTETELASIAVAFGSSKRSPVLLGSGKLWDQNRQSATAMAYSALSTSATSGPNYIAHQAFRSEIEQQQPLSRSASSGLSCSLVDRFGPSRNTSNTSGFDLGKKSSLGSASPDVASTYEQSGHAKQLLRQKLESRGGIGAETDRSKRASMSILQDISGNSNFSGPGNTQRPTSLPTTRPFKWDSGVGVEPGRSSAMKPRSEGHKRQSRQRISFVPSRPGSRLFATTLEEFEEEGLTEAAAERNVGSLWPTSLATFRPQIEITTTTPQKKADKDEGDYSATMSMYNIYTSEQGSTENLYWTPTRKPHAERSNARLSTAISENIDPSQWPRSGSSRDVLSRKPGDSLRPLSSEHAIFTGFEGKFPQPPKQPPKQRPPEWCLPVIRPIRGPRAAPAARSPSRRSPQRSSPLRQIMRSPDKSAPDIKTHVMRLRRMNSEISDTDAVTKRFLNMGGASSLPDTPEGSIGGDGEVFELVKPRERGDEKEVELGNFGRRLMEKARSESVGEREGPTGLGIEVDGWRPRMDWLGT